MKVGSLLNHGYDHGSDRLIYLVISCDRNVTVLLQNNAFKGTTYFTTRTHKEIAQNFSLIKSDPS